MFNNALCSAAVHHLLVLPDDVLGLQEKGFTEARVIMSLHQKKKWVAKQNK